MDSELKALRARGRDAWAAAYERHVDAVYQHALCRLRGDRPAAEDVTQEVFVRAIETIQAFDGRKGSLLQWLRGIARRVMSRRTRSLRPVAARTLTLSPDTDAETHDTRNAGEPADPRPLVDEQLCQREEQRLTACALSALPEHWEQALRWKYAEGLRVEEIAQRLGVSVKAAESLLSRARAAFRDTYAQFLVSGNGSTFLVEEHPDA